MRNPVTPFRLAAFTALLAFFVIVFGAFVRLSDAGLSCPDWPTCYGKATWPGHAGEIARANEAFPDRPFETHKAWREQVHRMLAGTLGTLVFALALVAAWPRRAHVAALLGAALAAAAGVALYMKAHHGASALLFAFAFAAPLAVAAILPRAWPWRIAVAAFGVVVFQAALGMWTVTLLLKPIVVMGHLLGGLLTFSLLAAVTLALAARTAPTDAQRRLRPIIVAALVLLSLQIALGGWTSANYAALACGADFPTCAGSWWPQTDFREGFVLWRGVGVNYEGGVLDAAARAAIQIAHRLGALVVFGHVLATAILAWRRGLRANAAAVAMLLCTQVALGILNVKLLLPLPVATAHNGVAALLLFSLIALLVRVVPPVAVDRRA
ncbi:COX15/CtaA family protein [Dokdonella fugitiva]|uniref:Cytochrome c oxidase assembly protein subunit 15 n=1 Tax=Dokdonella fugitiva TaxID=328517 RepID=A0A4R2I9X1_9GAMM|nr:COX15/CtaA family protein [Dokdonella fugitiva]TCO41234.1 cytochrome c oxidase assembly protein subunit 15 [Dokdonella fugitiva]